MTPYSTSRPVVFGPSSVTEWFWGAADVPGPETMVWIVLTTSR